MSAHLTFGRSGTGRKPCAWLGLLFALVFMLGVSAPVAQARTIDLGAGIEPTVAVDTAGTAFIASNGLDPNSPVVNYCKLPRGASACSKSFTLTPGGGSVSAPYTFVDAAGTVRLLTARYGFASGPFEQDLLYTSTDGGQSFGSPVSVGTVSPFGGDAVAGPGGSISITNGASATHAYQAVPTDGSSAGEGVAALSQAYPYEGSVGLVNATTPLVTFNDGHASPDTTAFSIYTGSGSLNDSARWSAPAVVATGAQGHLAGGPLGMLLMLRSPTGGNHLELRLFNGRAFGSPMSIAGSSGAGFDSAIAQDGGNRLHVVWAKANQLEYWTSTESGVSNPAPRVVATDSAFAGVRIALGSDHAGVAVWGTDSKHVHATVLAPPPLPSLSITPIQIGPTVSGTVVEVPVGAKLRVDLVGGRPTGRHHPPVPVLGSTTIRSVQTSLVRFHVRLNRQGRRALAGRTKLALTIRAIIIVGGKESVITSHLTLRR
jgi:hypothetical protein